MVPGRGLWPKRTFVCMDVCLKKTWIYDLWFMMNCMHTCNYIRHNFSCKMFFSQKAEANNK